MPQVRRKTYSRPIPPDATTTTTKDKKGRSVPAVRFKGNDGRPVIAPLVTSGPNASERCLVPSPCYYGTVAGKSVKLSTNKQASEVMLGDLLRKQALGQAGLLDPFETHNEKTLTEHLADHRRHLEGKGGSPRYVDLVISRLVALCAGCGWTWLRDLDADQATAWIARLVCGEQASVLASAPQYTPAEAASLLGISVAGLRASLARHRLAATGQGKARRLPRETVQTLLDLQGRGASPQTANHYTTHLKGFSRWLAKGRKIPHDPFQHLGKLNADADRRHLRRELSADELRRLLEATRASQRRWRGLAGEDRFHLYALACGTGFRAGGLASLTPECFELDTGVPTVTLPVKTDKSRRGKIQPLPGDVADLMRLYLQGKPRGRPVWPVAWAGTDTAAAMLRGDLESANIPYRVDGPDGPEFADFHSLRHTYLTLGGRAGIDLRTLQELAGHSTPTLTARYSHRRLHDLAGAVQTLPSFLPQTTEQTLRKTGTDGHTGPSREAVRLPAACLPLANSPVSEKGSKVVRSGERG